MIGCGDADLRVNRRHEHLDLHMLQGTPAGHPTEQPASQHVPLAGCGGADSRVNRRHEHLDLHMFQGTPAGHPTKQPASQHVPPCRMGRKSVRIGTFSYQNRYHLGQRSFPDFAPQNSKGWPGTSGSTDSETRVNRGARALCLHVNQRPRSQTASQHSARLGTLETRVNRSARALCLHVNRCSHRLGTSWEL